MSPLFRVCVLGTALAGVGCGGSVAEIGPATETPKANQEDIQKKMMEAYQKNQHEGQPTVAPPGGAAPAGEKTP